MTIEERGRDEIDAPSVDGYPMIDGELDPQIAELRRELLEQKANTTWVPEEDPYVVCVKIAREVGQFFVERGVDPKDLGEYEFNSLRDLLRQNWDFMTNHREFVEEVASDDFLCIMRKMAWWVRLCCEGASPVAAMYWLQMARILQRESESGEWLVKRLSPINLFMDTGQYQFGVDSAEDAKRVWQRHMGEIRMAMERALPFGNKLSIEVWDRDMNVWSDEDLVA